MEFIGPEEVRAGEPTEYEIIFENKSSSDLSDLSLTVRADAGIEFIEAPERTVIQRSLEGELGLGRMRKERVVVASWGKEDEERILEVTMRYRQGSGKSRFEKTDSIKIKIVQPALSLDAALPKRVIVGEDFSFSLSWKNEAEGEIPRIRAELTLSQDLDLLDSRPEAKATGTPTAWELENLKSGEAQQVSIVARALGEESDVKKLHLRVGNFVRGVFVPLAESEFEIGLQGNPLALAILVNDAKEYEASLGDRLTYTVSFKNNFDIALKDVVVEARLEGDMYDPASVETSGSYSSAQRKITWHGGNTPQLLTLNPQEGGIVNAHVKVRDSFPTGLKNAVIKMTATISTATKPRYVGVEKGLSQSAEYSAKVNGVLELTSKVYRRDPQRLFSNSGPWPMRANLTTQFAVYFTAKALGNDFQDVFAGTFLPNNVSFVGKTQGDLAGTEFLANPRTGEVSWKIPRLNAWETKKLMFQIAATPTVAQVGSTMQFLAQAMLVGLDEFTGNEYVIQSLPKDSSLPDDSAVSPEEGRVQP